MFECRGNAFINVQKRAFHGGLLLRKDEKQMTLDDFKKPEANIISPVFGGDVDVQGGSGTVFEAPPEFDLSALEHVVYTDNYKMSPTKMNMVGKLIRKLHVEQAIEQLTFCRKRGAVLMKDMVIEAICEAQHKGLDRDKLYVAEVLVTRGRTLKKLNIHGRGRMGVIRKRRCCVTVKVRECEVPLVKFVTQKPMEKQIFYQTKIKPVGKTIRLAN
eukprot:Nk52_evm1s1315 gene=Nk52_evmTU1s1315